MEEMQSIVKRIETDHNDLEAWQKLGELVDDPQKKNDCREQVARIRREMGGQLPASQCANENRRSRQAYPRDGKPAGGTVSADHHHRIQSTADHRHPFPGLEYWQRDAAVLG